jgi:glycosyltransferase involved in cell wall biosynthesis
MQRTLRVLYLVTAVTPVAERYTFDLTAGVIAAGNEVLIALPPSKLTKELKQSGYRTITLTEQNLKEAVVRYQPDIIHAVGFTELSSGLLRHAHYHGPLVISVLEANSLKSAGMMERLRAGTTLRLADCLITTSMVNAEIIKTLPFLSNAHIDPVSLGITPQPVEHQRSARRLLLEHTPLSGIINLWSNDTLWLGSITSGSEQNIIQVLTALGKLREEFAARDASFIYLLIGEQPDVNQKSIKNYIQANRLETNVFLIDQTDNVLELLTAFDIYISLEPSLTYSLLEAGAAARPVVVVDLETTVPIEQGNQTTEVLLPVHTESDLTDSIIALAYSPERRNRIGQSFKTLVEEEFQRSTMVKETIRIYRQLANTQN